MPRKDLGLSKERAKDTSSPILRRNYAPERSYSFFPDPEEARFFKEASTDDLAQVCENQPDMSARFTHELWRTRRYDQITELARIDAIPDFCEEPRDVPALRRVIRYTQDLVYSSSMMVHWGNVDPAEFFQFACESMVLTRMGTRGLSSPNQLSEVDKNRLKHVVSGVANIVQETIEEVQDNEMAMNIIEKTFDSKDINLIDIG